MNNGEVNNTINTSNLTSNNQNSGVAQGGNVPNVTNNVNATLNSTTPIVNNPPVINTPIVDDGAKSDTVINSNDPKISNQKMKKFSVVPILLFIIILLGVYIYYSATTHKNELESLKYNCTPITASDEMVKLDVNSTLVRDLYSKVSTSIREDLAEPEFNDSMRLYLAYRQVLESDKYDSNCNLFDKLKMEPYTCEVSTKFVPKAFKEEVLIQEIKKLYGEETNIPLQNIQLGTSCVDGWQYIAARGEFVQGLCEQKTATSFKVTKKLVEATSNRTTIILKEEVDYQENEKMNLPEYLKDGIYYYTFRLDMNYNYVLVSKTYENKYE